MFIRRRVSKGPSRFIAYKWLPRVSYTERDAVGAIFPTQKYGLVNRALKRFALQRSLKDSPRVNAVT